MCFFLIVCNIVMVQATILVMIVIMPKHIETRPQGLVLETTCNCNSFTSTWNRCSIQTLKLSNIYVLLNNLKVRFFQLICFGRNLSITFLKSFQPWQASFRQKVFFISKLKIFVIVWLTFKSIFFSNFLVNFQWQFLLYFSYRYDENQ